MNSHEVSTAAEWNGDPSGQNIFRVPTSCDFYGVTRVREATLTFSSRGAEYWEPHKFCQHDVDRSFYVGTSCVDSFFCMTMVSTILSSTC
jgi:hypothetical protein